MVLKFAHNKSPGCFQCKDSLGEAVWTLAAGTLQGYRAHPAGVLISFVGRQGMLPLKDEGQDLRDEEHLPLGSWCLGGLLAALSAILPGYWRLCTRALDTCLLHF